MKNHLIIGLGGTGGKIIRSFRKMIYQNFRKENPDKVHIAYLYMDSSSEMMDLNDPEWKVLGHSVQLGKNSQMKIGGANLHTILDNIQNYPGIKGWIGDKNQWKEILNSIVGETLGGQKRRLGPCGARQGGAGLVPVQFRLMVESIYFPRSGAMKSIGVQVSGGRR